ncbi:MAG: Glutamyl-tRNA synthetase @ Glutamyl-tRNA(Gln) synthetase [uncultured Rubrobacteraceae bacterium]|uniref:Glutamate--tRNA ligase n=1 Tax=uncultured Rubrobacteraceae bacterium TaxID=349277 RepID=A0A6J4QZ43_9ACTN|nr:MAG: Glutamyl-tRNA synthetase @ Glutamyl-tRNA(Gln) synthetase [uncultured Rubrobacteraceae bacterium]
MTEVRVRFAPSPTGMLHLGGARTALFNYLFAKHHGGTLLLRIEDTDRARSTRGFEEAQLEDLAWLGLAFDEGPRRQSGRGEVYEGAVERLTEAGLTYEITDEEGRRALYFRPARREGSFRDELRGAVSFSRAEDFVIRKSDGTPSYNFAAVVDDTDMGITHVIRGEEHLPNTGRQALLYRALGLAEPKFVHLGVILGPDGKKLSKRHGAASVADYRREGYLPEALLNHLVLLGWTHPSGREDFDDLDGLVREWDPSRLGASPSTFDPDRLLYFDARHIRRLAEGELRRRVEPFLDGPLPEGREAATLEVIREEARVLSDAPRLLREVMGPVDPTAFADELPGSSTEVFDHIAASLHGRELRDVEAARGFVAELRAWAKERGIKTRDLLHPLRLALTGQNSGPEMGLVLAVLGSGEARARIEQAREARLGS